MEAMRKEIERLNDVISKGCMNNKKSSGKENQPKKPQYKDGRHPHIKAGLGHTKGGKTNRRKVINGYECVQFMSKGRIGTDQPAQKVAQKQPRAAQPPKDGSATVKDGSAAPPTEKGRLPPLFLLMTSPRRRCISQSKSPKNQKNQFRAIQTSMLINQRQIQ
jgi:hypothetical protein